MKSKDSNSKKSVSYQKKDGRGHTCPSFFWYDNDKDKVSFLVTHIIFGSYVRSLCSSKLSSETQDSITYQISENYTSANKTNTKQRDQ